MKGGHMNMGAEQSSKTEGQSIRMSSVPNSRQPADQSSDDSHSSSPNTEAASMFEPLSADEIQRIQNSQNVHIERLQEQVYDVRRRALSLPHSGRNTSLQSLFNGLDGVSLAEEATDLLDLTQLQRPRVQGHQRAFSEVTAQTPADRSPVKPTRVLQEQSDWQWGPVDLRHPVVWIFMPAWLPVALVILVVKLILFLNGPATPRHHRRTASS